MKKIILMLALTANLVAEKHSNELANIIFLEDEDQVFDYLNNQEPVVLMVFMERCGHCNDLKPKLNDLAGEGHKVLAINYEKCPSLVKQYKIDGFPATLIFEPGKTYTDKQVGGNNIAGIKDALNGLK